MFVAKQCFAANFALFAQQKLSPPIGVHGVKVHKTFGQLGHMILHNFSEEVDPPFPEDFVAIALIFGFCLLPYDHSVVARGCDLNLFREKTFNIVIQ